MPQPAAKPAPAKPSHLYIIDGYGFVFRAYHSLPPLTNPEGTPVGAVYGFTNMLLKLKRQVRGNGGTGMVMVLDAGKDTFRNEIYAGYKANRPPAPEDLIPQFPLIREAVEALNLPVVEAAGFEADDIIATYVKQAKEAGVKVTIVSSDKDLMQLVGEDVEMFDAMKNRTIGIKEVQEKWGVGPDKVLDMLALVGDTSDNIPGVPGIGPVTAAQLLEQFGNLEKLLERAGEIPQVKRREAIIEHADKARLSRRLAALRYDVPLDSDLSHFALRPDNQEKLLPFLLRHGFKSLAGKLEGEHAHAAAQFERQDGSRKPADPGAVREDTALASEKALAEWLKRMVDNGNLALLPIFTRQQELIALTLATSNLNTGRIHTALVPLSGKGSVAQDDLFASPSENATAENALTLSACFQALAPFLADPSVLKVGYDVKSWWKVFPLPGKAEGLIRDLMPQHQGGPGSDYVRPGCVTPHDDLLVMAYTLDGTKYKRELGDLCEQHLGKRVAWPEELQKLFEGWDKTSPEEWKARTGELAAALLTLQGQFRRRLFNEKMLTLYETIERPLVNVLARMEQAGIKVDPDVLRRLTGQFSADIERLEKEIFRLAGREFTIGSPKQLGEVLFDEMKIQGGKTSAKSGYYKTDSDVLEELAAQGHAIAESVMRWRELTKLRSTYTEALAKLIGSDGRVHTTYNMAATTTGRLSSTDPNLQNIPIRTEEGRKIRTAFVAEKGNVLISADYSQIELRLLAHMANIDTLKAAFREGKDIHRLTASQVFGMPLEQVTPEQRRAAKAINFGIIYGQSAFGLAASLGIDRRAAQEYIERYFEQYPGIRKYMEQTKAVAHAQGYVTTLFGRKCFLPGIHTKGPQRAFAERAAINAPLQGTAADIIKKAMVTLEGKLRMTPSPQPSPAGRGSIEPVATSFTERKKAAAPSLLPPGEGQDEGAHLRARLLLQVHDELIIEAPEHEAEAIAKIAKHTMEQVVQLSVPLTVETGIGRHWGEAH